MGNKSSTQPAAPNTLELLVYGYIRNEEKTFNSFIPDGIYKIVQDLYPISPFRFGDFKQGLFIVNDDKTILKGTDGRNSKPCHGNMVYADLGELYDRGINNGVHLWSVKCLVRRALCFASIGVTTEKNDKWINEWYGKGKIQWINKGYNSFCLGSGKWNKDEVITIKLDCNQWTVKYYKDSDKTEFQTDHIEPYKSYYFALLICNLSNWSHYEIIESPSNLFA